MILLKLLKHGCYDGLPEEFASVLDLVLVAEELYSTHFGGVKYHCLTIDAFAS